MQDDINDGYFILEGTIVYANKYGLKFLHDPKEYADPMTFNPDRFLGSQPEHDPREYCFAFGRRLKSGCHLAETFVWLSCATSLAVFNISKPVDAAGRPIEPVIDFSSTTLRYSSQF
ncbi:hypothetical protein NEOLEDRAFT_1212056 [Neolentinus lepideus HHB14362 ss-1]|uniref:Cytochrome P450 n=1 Tax=Neolentinus lepideus HHB14362 ss-1 TaxID=1314782 RepID=A0A165RA29_9AGAM|nr:hypothetical protein NEOLEDRAFT_1212056 [Neolentinus lepideus HHB14362 ss-1]